ncbi:Hypothetical predicted protein [Marmota monax]|uniref:Uncharacterized protein n=1 Tax=Marmota monax TaxID=9995 RepID=A0A5E4BXN4_MARMO|nr:Hypothetical predicted protein [Marmota monax]
MTSLGGWLLGHLQMLQSSHLCSQARPPSPGLPLVTSLPQTQKLLLDTVLAVGAGLVVTEVGKQPFGRAGGSLTGSRGATLVLALQGPSIRTTRGKNKDCECPSFTGAQETEEEQAHKVLSFLLQDRDIVHVTVTSACPWHLAGPRGSAPVSAPMRPTRSSSPLPPSPTSCLLLHIFIMRRAIREIAHPRRRA